MIIQSEAPPVKSVEEDPETMNATTEVNSHLLYLVQDNQQQFSTLATTNNRTNPPNPPKPYNPSNYLYTHNRRRCNTSKYC